MNTVLNPTREKINLATLIIMGIVLAIFGDFLFYKEHLGATSLALFFTSLFLLSIPFNKKFYNGFTRKALLGGTLLSVFAVAYDKSAMSVFLCVAFVVGFRISVLYDRNDSILKRFLQTLLFVATFIFEFFVSEKDRLGATEYLEKKEKCEKNIAKSLLKWTLIAFFALIFICLFSLATPIIHNAMSYVVDFCKKLINPSKIVFIIFIFLISFAFLRMGILGAFFVQKTEPEIKLNAQDSDWLKSFLLYALVTFNLIFLVQNFFDLLWFINGMKLPEGTTYSEYANGGAISLAAATFIAAIFIIATFRPQNNDASWKKQRVLAYIWLGQNIFLLFSASMRMMDYVWSYGLTDTRLMGFSFFAIVGIGLILSIIKIASNKTTGWLVNANFFNIAICFLCWAIIDFHGLSIGYNVNRYLNGKGLEFDFSYIAKGGIKALPAAIKLRSTLLEEKNSQERKRIEVTYYGIRRPQYPPDSSENMAFMLDSFIETQKNTLNKNIRAWKTASIHERIIAARINAAD